ncbi:MAG TPA: DUF5050 domain-containing protein [Patescibacteria group bacterium]|nr:DUF5050 domain-containing protein [Patescibacteria group bacterium]
MSDNAKNKSEKTNGTLHKVDPEVEAKVDSMMSTDPIKPKTTPDQGAQTYSVSAPLLPGEKLPDFDSKPDKKPIKHPIVEAATVPAHANDLNGRPGKKLDDPQTNSAVDDIVQKESDRMLAIEDAKADLLAEGSAEIDRGFFNRLKSKLSSFWANPKARMAVLAIFFIILATIAIIPSSRYFALNSVGVRASASFRIIDENTGQPLKNVEVSLADKSGKTDKDGNTRLTGIKLGSQQLSVKKPAFAEFSQKTTIGWGSNPKGDVSLKAVGSRYNIVVKDFVSDQPVKSAEAVSGEASATTNEKGEIVLVVADQDKAQVDIEIVAANYRTEKITLEVGDKQTHNISFVPAKKHAFVSKRTGKYDLYKIDIDGKNEEQVLAGTGTESEDKIAILPSSKNNLIAYVSNRADQRNADGFVLSSLMLVNLDDNSSQKIDFSERIQLVDFIGDNIVYVKIVEGESAASPNRHKLLSYDIGSENQKQLTNANYFNDVTSAKGSIYYAPAAYQADGNVGLFKINPDGTGKTTIYGQEVWNIFRVAYDKLDASVGQDWYEYDLLSGQFDTLEGSPADMKTRIYADSSDGKNSAWVDERDGKGVLLIYDTGAKEEKIRQTQSGLRNPIHWLDNDHLVYRVSTSSEVADYAISLSGGDPKKIKDVTNTAGLDRWYYY